jgi:hypothetical protein
LSPPKEVSANDRDNPVLIALRDLAPWIGVHYTNARKYVLRLEKPFLVKGRLESGQECDAVTEEDAVEILRLRVLGGYTIGKRPASLRKVTPVTTTTTNRKRKRRGGS